MPYITQTKQNTQQTNINVYNMDLCRNYRILCPNVLVPYKKDEPMDIST